jgi:uncharacterized protein YjdB
MAPFNAGMPRRLITSVALGLLMTTCSSYNIRGGGDQVGGRPPANVLTIAPTRVSLIVNQSIELRAEVKDPTSRAEAPHQWSTDDPDIATVVGMGMRAVVTGVRTGRTVVRLRTGNELEASVNAAVR